jgi:hypothetical protein
MYIHISGQLSEPYGASDFYLLKKYLKENLSTSAKVKRATSLQQKG